MSQYHTLLNHSEVVRRILCKHCVMESFRGVFVAVSNSRNFRAIRFFEKAKGSATQHLPAEEKGRKRGRREEEEVERIALY